MCACILVPVLRLPRLPRLADKERSEMAEMGGDGWIGGPMLEGGLC